MPQTVNDLLRRSTGSNVKDLDDLHVDDVRGFVLGVEDGGSLCGDPHDQVLELRTVNGQPDSSWKIKVEHRELGEQPVRLGLLVRKGSQSFADGYQGTDELLLRRKPWGATGTWTEEEIRDTHSINKIVLLFHKDGTKLQYYLQWVFFPLKSFTAALQDSKHVQPLSKARPLVRSPSVSLGLGRDE